MFSHVTIGTSDLARAIAFVGQQATTLEQARLRYILKRTPIPPIFRAQLFADQQNDGGGAPFWAGSYTALE